MPKPPASAGKALTKAAIEDIFVRGDFAAWRGLVQAMRKDETGRIRRRAREVAAALAPHEERARAFAALLPLLLQKR